MGLRDQFGLGKQAAELRYIRIGRSGTRRALSKSVKLGVGNADAFELVPIPFSAGAFQEVAPESGYVFGRPVDSLLSWQELREQGDGYGYRRQPMAA